MAQVNTVLGPIHPKQLGRTSLHEHIVFNTPGWEYSPEAHEAFPAPKVFERIYNDLIEFKEAGGSAIVDVSGIGIGRDVELYVCLSRYSGVHIVACTGFWAERKILPYFAERNLDYHTSLFIKELTQGMGTTNVRAGVIKVGNSGDRFTKLEEMTYRAAARASKKTGAAIVTHGTQFARKQVEVLLEEGVDPIRVIISHLDAKYALDMERDKEVARKGFYIGYDHIGTEETWSKAAYAMPDTKRVEMVLEIIRSGFLKQLVLANDTNGWSAGIVTRGTQEHTYAHLLKNFVPLLLKAGVTEEQINTMLVETPQRLLPF